MPKILVIDDEPTSRDILIQFFSQIGCEVTTAQDGQDGLEKMKDGPFDLIFLDLNMPNMTGLETLPRIRDLDIQARIIIMTAYASYESKVEAREQGAYDYLVKPITITKLKEVTDKAIPDRPRNQAASQTKSKKVRIDPDKLDRKTVLVIPERIARAYFLVALSRHENTLTVAMADPNNTAALDTVSTETGLLVQSVQADRQDIMMAIQFGYSAPPVPADVPASPSPVSPPPAVPPAPQPPRSQTAQPEETAIPQKPASTPLQNIEFGTDAASEMIDRIFTQAVQRKARSIYIEPLSQSAVIRFRLDKEIHPFTRLPVRICNALITHIRELAQHNPDGQSPLPQGSLRLRIQNVMHRFSYHILSTIHGESVTIHLHEHHDALVDIKDLGFNALNHQFFLNAIQQPCGMVYITGPPDNGGITTLYAALRHINDARRKIITLEDPVTYEINGISQVALRFDLGQSYASALRGLLHHAPDVILIDETPDAETASLAVRAAADRHLVLSTVQAPDAVACLLHLRDLGIQPFQISRILNLIVAQYRTRQICLHCKTATTPSQQVLDQLASFKPSRMPTTFFTGAGCSKCSTTGFHGHTAFHEFLPMTDNLKQAILHNFDASQIRQAAKAADCPSLLDAGLSRVADGQITLDDLIGTLSHI